MSEERASEDQASTATPSRGSVLEVLGVFTRLGLTSFGGPIAHLGYMKTELVDRRRWADDATYADLVALCQFLPGPASSQVGIAMGIERAGLLGGLAAWIGFTLPSALALALFAMGLGSIQGAETWLHGLKLVAVPVVALAVRGMAVSLCPDRARASIAVAAAVAVLMWQSALTQVVVIAAAALAGWAIYRREIGSREGRATAGQPLPAWLGVASLALFFVLLMGLPALTAATESPVLDVLTRFYRVGALVFGGGHVVLPLLEHEVVDPGWTTSDRFLAGYGAAQAVPGPLFSFAAYLGFVLDTTPTGWLGAALALVAIYIPSFLLVIGALPFWARIRGSSIAQAALRGANAGVVGLLVAALYDPVWRVGIESPQDLAIALAALLALTHWSAPPWLVVVATALASGLMRMATG